MLGRAWIDRLRLNLGENPRSPTAGPSRLSGVRLDQRPRKTRNLLVPRPRHSKKDSAAADQFREGLAEKLEALELPEGSRAKLWLMNEARFGRHTELRRLWARKGQRPVVTRKIK